MTNLIFTYWPEILTVTGIHMAALISPGPDFAIVVRNSLVFSRAAALATALGIALGVMIHVSYILLGLGALICQTLWLFMGLKILGAGYLLYIGYQGLRAQKTIVNEAQEVAAAELTLFQAVRSGILTNALNPKAMLFILSLFTVVIAPEAPRALLSLYAGIIFVTTLMWFSLVALFLSTPRIKQAFVRSKHWIERLTGGALFALGAKLAFLTARP